MQTKRKWKVWAGVKVQSECNMHEHWRVRHERKLRQQKITRIWMIKEIPARDRDFSGKYRILFTRLKGRGQRDFDSDNLAISFKHVRDGVASFMGIDDGSPRLDFVQPKQRKPDDGEFPGVLIEIEEIASPCDDCPERKDATSSEIDGND